jgi:hypothetical protein
VLASSGTVLASSGGVLAGSGTVLASSKQVAVRTPGAGFYHAFTVPRETHGPRRKGLVVASGSTFSHIVFRVAGPPFPAPLRIRQFSSLQWILHFRYN